MRIRSYRLIGAILAAGFFGVVASCPRLPAQEEKPTPAVKETQPEEATGGADVMLTSWGTKKVTLMKGNVHFEHGDTVMTSAEVEYTPDKKNPVAMSPGKLRITNPDCDVTGDKGVAYFAKRTGVVEGNVVMIVKPKKSVTDTPKPAGDGQSLKEQPTTVTCPRLEYNYKKKTAVATGGVVFKQSKRSLVADKAVFDQAKEFLVLTGNVKGVDEDGQTFSAPGKVEISLKEGDEWMRAENAQATFKIEVEEETAE